ncbi:putative ORFan [Tupanvirus deep ocean]|uniref:ORFan n=2 Tax=Tupanvirus TaxID=2094720 RepID=A0AC62A6R6_9VIRU|nr:putative ORFan [Tupanvirus deep ocean]QKU33485.1 putative ORFan [Tupanvirus deep ocean]
MTTVVVFGRPSTNPAKSCTSTKSVEGSVIGCSVVTTVGSDASTLSSTASVGDSLVISTNSTALAAAFLFFWLARFLAFLEEVVVVSVGATGLGFESATALASVAGTSFKSVPTDLERSSPSGISLGTEGVESTPLAILA